MKTVQILIRWLSHKPADLDLHYFLKRIYRGSAGEEFNYFRFEPNLGYFFIHNAMPFYSIKMQISKLVSPGNAKFRDR